MRVLAFFLGLLLMVEQAAALSCKRPNLASSFNRFAQSDDTYRLAVGGFAYKQKIPTYKGAKPRHVKAAFTGQFLGLNGLTEIRSVPITIATTCVAHWCGGFPEEGGQNIVFLKQTSDGMTLERPACPNGALTPYSKERLNLVQRCLRRGKCTKAEEQLFEFK